MFKVNNNSTRTTSSTKKLVQQKVGLGFKKTKFDVEADEVTVCN